MSCHHPWWKHVVGDRVNAPTQIGQWVNAHSIQPSPFWAVVAVLALLYATCPTSVVVSLDPATLARRFLEAKHRPSVTAFWMLEDAAKPANVKQGAFETSMVVALALNFPLFDVARLAFPEPPPSLAGRVRDNRVWPHVGPRVFVLVVRLDAFKIEVRATGGDI